MICKTSQRQALFPCLRSQNGRTQDQWLDPHQSRFCLRGIGVLESEASDPGLAERLAAGDTNERAWEEEEEGEKN